MPPLRVCLAGATGRVGRALARAVAGTEDLRLVAAVARLHAGRRLGDVLKVPEIDAFIAPSVEDALDEVEVDVLVDFTSAEAVREHVEVALRHGVAVVVGSSGLTDEDYARIDAVARQKRIGVFAAGNFSLTATLLQRFAVIAAAELPSWEIIDYAPPTKLDAPSGTSRELASRLATQRPDDAGPKSEHFVGDTRSRGASVGGTPVHSVRLPGFQSAIEVVFGLDGERLLLRHEATDGGAPYVNGALYAIRRVRGLVGVVRGLDSLRGRPPAKRSL